MNVQVARKGSGRFRPSEFFRDRMGGAFRARTARCGMVCLIAMGFSLCAACWALRTEEIPTLKSIYAVTIESPIRAAISLCEVSDFRPSLHTNGNKYDLKFKNFCNPKN
jgi:hypothetical protein